MMKNCFLWIVLLVVSGCLACQNGARPDATATPPAIGLQSAPSPEAAVPIIVAFGDSLTAGYGLLSTQNYPSLLQEKLRADRYEYRVVNAGVNGDTAAAGLQRLDRVLQGNVRFAVVELGGNDILKGQPIAETKKTLGQIIGRIKARKVEVLLAGVYAPDSTSPTYQKEVREAYKSLAREYQVAFIPFLLDRVAGVKSLNLDDGLHPNAEGTKIMTDTVYRALRPMLEKEKGLSSKRP